MKVVVDIPNWLYDAMMEHREPVYSQSLGEAVRDGTPLLKGHRFIDADEILNHAFITEDEEEIFFVQKYYCIEKEVMDNALVLFDTLEADKEQE